MVFPIFSDSLFFRVTRDMLQLRKTTRKKNLSWPYLSLHQKSPTKNATKNNRKSKLHQNRMVIPFDLSSSFQVSSGVLIHSAKLIIFSI